MKKLSVLVIMALAASASAAVIEDFEAWTGTGTVVADPDNAANSTLQLAGGEAIAIALPANAGIMTVDVYDMGATDHDIGQPNTNNSGYGPRWGVADVGNSTSVAASIINKTFLNSNNGYGWGYDLSRTSSWWSPMWFGGPRNVDALQVIGTGTWDNPEVPGDGDWATWTFYINTSGTVTVTDGNNTVMGAMRLNGVASTEMWLSGGRSGMVLNGTALFDNITFDVPEPATMSLLALGGLAMLRRRR
jgi:hypothetical protein